MWWVLSLILKRHEVTKPSYPALMPNRFTFGVYVSNMRSIWVRMKKYLKGFSQQVLPKPCVEPGTFRSLDLQSNTLPPPLLWHLLFSACPSEGDIWLYWRLRREGFSFVWSLFQGSVFDTKETRSCKMTHFALTPIGFSIGVYVTSWRSISIRQHEEILKGHFCPSAAKTQSWTRDLKIFSLMVSQLLQQFFTC